MSKEKEDYKEKILETIEGISDSKMKLLYEIVEIMDIFPLWAVEYTKDFLTERFFSLD